MLIILVLLRVPRLRPWSVISGFFGGNSRMGRYNWGGPLSEGVRSNRGGGLTLLRPCIQWYGYQVLTLSSMGCALFRAFFGPFGQAPLRMHQYMGTNGQK